MKSVRLFGREPDGWVTSARKLVVAALPPTEGVANTVTGLFCVTGAPEAAWSVTVKDWPGEITAGTMVEVVPAGSPLTEGVISKSTFCEGEGERAVI